MYGGCGGKGGREPGGWYGWGMWRRCKSRGAVEKWLGSEGVGKGEKEWGGKEWGRRDGEVKEREGHIVDLEATGRQRTSSPRTGIQSTCS